MVNKIISSKFTQNEKYYTSLSYIFYFNGFFEYLFYHKKSWCYIKDQTVAWFKKTNVFACLTLEQTINHVLPLKWIRGHHLRHFLWNPFSILFVTKRIFFWPQFVFPLNLLLLHSISTKYPNFMSLGWREGA